MAVEVEKALMVEGGLAKEGNDPNAAGENAAAELPKEKFEGPPGTTGKLLAPMPRPLKVKSDCPFSSGSSSS